MTKTMTEETKNKHPPLKNHPNQPFPTKKRGFRYIEVKSVSRSRKWGWTALGPNGDYRLQENFYTSTIKNIRAEIADHLIMHPNDEIIIYYNRKRIEFIWGLTRVKEQVTMYEFAKTKTPRQHSLWSVGMADQAEEDSIFDYGWANFTYKTFKSHFTSRNKAYLFVNTKTTSTSQK